MNFLKNNFGKILLIAFVVCVPMISIAQGNIPAPKCNEATQLCNPISQDTIQGFIKVMLEGALKIAIPIIALALIYSGFLFVQAQGNPGELETAKNSLIYTLLGAAILLGAWAIAQLVADTILTL